MDSKLSMQTKSAHETQRSLRKCIRPEENPRSFHIENSVEFIESCQELIWNHERSTSHRSETNGRVKLGTSSVLVQSGFQESWWAEATQCSCYLRNVPGLLAGSQTPSERRINSPFEGRLFHLEQKCNFIQYQQKTEVECISSAQKYFLEFSMDALCTRGGGEEGELDWWSIWN